MRFTSLTVGIVKILVDWILSDKNIYRGRAVNPP